MDRPTRLFEIVQLLAGRRPKTVQEIAGRFEISERTAYRDLAELSRRHIPITRSDHGYQLLESATIRPLSLTAAERAVLKLLLENPAVRPTVDIRRTLELVEAKLDAATWHSEETPRALTLAGPERSGAIAPGVTPLLDTAIRERTPVSLSYRSLAGGRKTWRGVDPYEVFHRENAWYLVGRCHLHDEPRVFRLDRVSDAEALRGTFEPPAFDLEEHLQHTWGVYRGRELYDVVVHFDAPLAPLLEGGLHHPDERIERLGNGSLEYRVTLSHLGEVARWIVSFGGQARAVAPPALARIVADLGLLSYERHAHDDAPSATHPRPQQDLPGLVREAAARQRSLDYDRPPR